MLRRLVILVLLSGLMVGLHLYHVTTDGLIEPKSLATFGFVLLAAFIIGEVAAALKLPRVTGYLVAGIAFGPDAADFFERGVVEDLRLINSLAVGLIALTAGGELRLHELKQNYRAILLIIMAQTLVIVPLVLGVFALTGSHLVPWGSLGVTPSSTLILALGAMLGAIAIGNSPSVAVAIVNDTGARGHFTSLNLGVTITKDLVVVVLFSIVTALAVGQLDPDGEGFTATLIVLAIELLESIAVGLLLGTALWAYLRWVGQEVMLFLVGLIFLGMFLADAWHMERILVFIVAGFVVENFSARGDAMIQAIERVSPPVYVVFFAIAGAGLELGVIKQMLAIALVLGLVRIGAMSFSTWVGARLAGLRPLFQQKLGLGFFSQAGVTLGLVFIATDQLDAIVLPGTDTRLGSDLFSPVMMGIVALNLLVGPVFLKLSLSASGETADRRGRDAVPPQPAHAAVAAEDKVACEPVYPALGDAAADARVSRPSALFPPPERHPERGFEETELDPELQHSLSALQRGLEGAVDDLRWEVIEPERSESRLVLERLRDHTRFVFADVLGRLASVSDPDAQRQWVRRSRVALAEAFYSTLLEERSETVDLQADEDAFVRFFSAVQALPERAPKAIGVQERPYLFVPRPGDGAYLKVRKSLSRLRRRFTTPQERVVRLRRLIEFYVSGPLPPSLVSIANMAGSQRFYFWRKVSVLVRYVDAEICAVLRRLADPILIEPAPIPGWSTEAGNDEQPRDASDPTEAAASDRERQIALEKAAVETAQHLERIAATCEEDFELALRDIDEFADELHRRLRSVLAGAYRGLADACRVAGTYQLPERSVNTSKVYDLHRAGRDEVFEALRLWRTACLGYSGRLLAVLDIIDLQHVAFGRVAEAKIDIANALLNELRPVPVSVAQQLQTMLRAAEAHLGKDVEPTTALAFLDNTREQLVEHSLSGAIDRLESSRDRGKFMDLLEPFAQKLAEDSIELTHTYDVIAPALENLDEGVTPRGVRLDELPIREVAREMLGGEVAVKLSAVNGIINRAVDLTLSGLSDIQRVITFNIDAASTELNNFIQEPDASEAFELAREFALGGLRRSLARVKELVTVIDRTERQVGAMIQYETFQQLSRLRRMAVEADATRVRAYLTQRSIEGRGREAASGVRGLLARLRLTADEVRLRYLRPVAYQAGRALRARLGFEQPLTAPLVELTDLASFLAVQNEAVPATYRRLFSNVPVELEEFFVGRIDEVQEFSAAFARFQRGAYSSLLVTGAIGAGTTSFIDHALRQLDTELPVERMFFSHNFHSERQLAVMLGDLLGEQGRDLARLRARLRNAKQRRIVVVEGLHNFYLRTLDGFDALQKFLMLVAETSHVFFWVVTCNLDAYRYLRGVVALADHFTQVVELRNLKPSEIKRLIEARHNVSGYELRFLHENDAASLTWLWGEPRQEQLEATFYQRLADCSEGNTTAALYYWLRALRGVADESFIEVDPVAPLRLSFLEGMDPDKLLALATLIGHGGLSLADFARVFRVTRDAAYALLTNLVQLNLVVVEPGRVDTYQVNAVLYPAISKALYTRHIL